MKQIKNIFLFVIAVSFSISCKKELDQQPKDTFSDENSFLSWDDVQKGANGAYGRYGGTAGNNGGYINDMYVSALVSDEAKIGADNTGFGALTYRYQYTSDPTAGGDVIDAWGGYYSVIDQVNRILPKIPTVTATPDQEPRRSIVEAQLIALRAISHFGLLQSYSKNYDAADVLGVPIMLVSDATGKPARNTIAEVVSRIEADLAASKAALPAIASPADFSDTVMNRINIAAYQARVALYKRDFDAAITYSTEVISSMVKPLVSGPDFQQIWTDDNDNETLFRIRYLTSGAVGGLWTTTGGNVSIAPSDKLIASYDPADIRATTYIGTNGSGNKFVNKFFVSSRGGRVVDLKACRTAEMYLIRAEASAKKASPDLTQGASDLNFLRSYRIFGYVNETFANASDLVAAVLQERFKELAFEGFRFFDLKRNNLPVERLITDASAAWQTLPALDTRFVLPIPRYEINTNPNIVQNNGY